MMKTLTLCVVSAAVLALAGCNRNDGSTVGQKLDTARTRDPQALQRTAGARSALDSQEATLAEGASAVRG